MTIYLDEEILRSFRAMSEKTGKGYQTLLDEALNAYLGANDEILRPELVRKIVREELAAHQ
jgi:hypothetical protein